jgi:hypothetical protein
VESPVGQSQPAADRQRLNGWKDIANHLGKAVRTVQRWERERGLPIRRVPDSEIVYAFRDEIDAWSAADTTLPQEPQVRPGVETTRSRRTTYVLSGVAVLFAVVAISGFAMWWLRPPALPASAALEGSALVVRDLAQREIWRQSFDFEFGRAAYETPRSDDGTDRVLVTDLDRDGRNEVVFGISSKVKDSPQGIRVFNGDGTLRFAVEPNPTIRFGTEDFAGPWSLFRMFVLDNPDGTRSLWAAFIHGLWFPTLVIEIDEGGTTKSQYWSNGYVHRVAVARWKGQPVVLVGATNNDSRGASLAIFDYGKVGGAAPAVIDEFKCKNCPPGGPREFLIFPRRCLALAVNGQAVVTEAWIDDHDRLYTFAAEGTIGTNALAGGVWYTVNHDLSVASAEIPITVGPVHRSLEQQGRIDHPFTLRGDHGEPALTHVLRWDHHAGKPLELPR